jgi:hypothetical protein
VSAKTIAIFETGERQRPKLDLQHVREVLQSAGVEFIAENGGGAGVTAADVARRSRAVE